MRSPRGQGASPLPTPCRPQTNPYDHGEDIHPHQGLRHRRIRAAQQARAAALLHPSGPDASQRIIQLYRAKPGRRAEAHPAGREEAHRTKAPEERHPAQGRGGGHQRHHHPVRPEGVLHPVPKGVRAGAAADPRPPGRGTHGSQTMEAQPPCPHRLENVQRARPECQALQRGLRPDADHPGRMPGHGTGAGEQPEACRCTPVQDRGQNLTNRTTDGGSGGTQHDQSSQRSHDRHLQDRRCARRRCNHGQDQAERRGFKG